MNDEIIKKLSELPPLGERPENWLLKDMEDFNRIRSKAVSNLFGSKSVEEYVFGLVQHVLDIDFVLEGEDVVRFYYGLFNGYDGDHAKHFKGVMLSLTMDSYQANKPWISDYCLSNSGQEFQETKIWKHLESIADVDISHKSTKYDMNKMIVTYTIKWRQLPVIED